jgi:AcrR family transcriptional regulator
VALSSFPGQNGVLMIDRETSERENSVAARLAQRALSKREAGYASEVRRLLDAGLEVMRACGTTSRPRVADIVAAAGLSNEAFYRHFPSKEALVAAILEDGTERLRKYLAHQMDKESAPQDKVRRWVEGVLSQAVDEDIAATTLAVLWNAGSGGDGLASGHSSINPPLATLLQQPLAALGSRQPELDASLASHATVGRMTECLLGKIRPSDDEIAEVADFCLRAVTPTKPFG